MDELSDPSAFAPLPSTDLDDLFGEDYRRLHLALLDEGGTDEEATELVGLLGLAPGARVLDAGCGDGRIAVRLASLGFEVVGVDRSLEMIELARAAAERRGLSIELRRHDLEQLELEKPVDGAALWFNTVGYLPDARDEAMLRQVRQHLRPGGVLVVDTLNHDGVVRNLTASPDAVVLRSDDVIQIDVSSFDPSSGRLIVDRTTLRDGRERHQRFSQRLRTPPEWRGLLESMGFVDVEISGRRGEALSIDTWELVVVARTGTSRSSGG